MTKPVQIINNYWLKETILNGNPDLDKFYKEDLIKMVNVLKTENKKYKEVINKAIKYINSNPNVYYDEYLIDVETLKANETTEKFVGEVKFISKLLSILKEVEHEKSNN